MATYVVVIAVVKLDHDDNNNDRDDRILRKVNLQRKLFSGKSRKKQP